MRALYLCYFGLREPLVQTQVLPYLRHLAAAGVRITLLTFEPEPRRRWSAEEVAAWRERLAGDGIDWRFRTYHKRPSLPATVYDILVGAWTAIRLARKERVDLFHGRAHVAAAMGALAKAVCGGQLLFDIRGFIPEEYVDAGVWRRGDVKFRATKAAERRLLRAADGFVVLTERARDILFPGCGDEDRLGRPIAVIPCCVDLERFRAGEALDRDEVRRSLGLAERRVLVYVGALGGFYLTEEMARCIAVAHRQDARTFSLILTQSRPEIVTEPLSRFGVPEGAYRVFQAPPEEVPRYLKAADLALSFIKPSYSKQSSSPTKLAEYLAAGLPVLCNAGVGDVDRIVDGWQVGTLVREFSETAYLDALRAIDSLREDPKLAARCRRCAEELFDLRRVGGRAYVRLYRRLMERQAPAAQEAPEVG